MQPAAAPTPAEPYVRGVYRRRADRPWRDVEIVGRHRSGRLVLRELGKLWRGIWLASLDQVRIPTGLVLEVREQGTGRLYAAGGD